MINFKDQEQTFFSKRLSVMLWLFKLSLHSWPIGGAAIWRVLSCLHVNATWWWNSEPLSYLQNEKDTINFLRFSAKSAELGPLSVLYNFMIQMSCIPWCIGQYYNTEAKKKASKTRLLCYWPWSIWLHVSLIRSFIGRSIVARDAKLLLESFWT